MRISTFALHAQAIAAITRNQASLAHTQNQVALSTRLVTAADDPAAWAQAASLDQHLSRLDQYRANVGVAQGRLGLEENALSGASDSLNRIRELAVQANASGQSAESRHSIALEMQTRLEELVAVANSDDGTGRYLFAGSADGTAPFSLDASGATYSGDQNIAQLQVGNQRSVATGDAGDLVFQKLRSGNGTIAVSARASNTGTAQLTGAKVDDASLWDRGTYTVQFSGGQYQVRDAGDVVVSSGTYQAGTAIRFRGVEMTLSGTPADGDSMTLSPSQPQDVFQTVQKMIRLVDSTPPDAAGRAQQQTQFFGAFEEIDGALNHFSDVRSTVGNRLAALDDAQAQADTADVQVQSSLSGLRDLDYAEATGRLALQTTALQAAQQSYVKIQGLSLFDYLR